MRFVFRSPNLRQFAFFKQTVLSQRGERGGFFLLRQPCQSAESLGPFSTVCYTTHCPSPNCMVPKTPNMRSILEK